LPLLNTVLLVTSSVTLTIAHHALNKGHRGALKFWLGLTILLGIGFLGFQAEE
jgi:cytochrome c oxidase subunit 3